MTDVARDVDRGELLRVGTVDLWVDVCGEGRDTVVLVAGADSPGFRWDPGFVDRLVAEGFRVVRFDHRDCGRSSWLGADAGYLLADLVADLVGLLDRLEVDAAHLVGRSMGGMIAQVMARRNSQARIAHIAHIGSSTRADAFARAWLRCALVQVCGGSQSFNVVNTLRKLARWMRMPCVTNQSSVPKAWQEFDDKGRMKPSPLRDRVVDVCEEFYKFTLVRDSGMRKDMLLACLLHGLNNVFRDHFTCS